MRHFMLMLIFILSFCFATGTEARKFALLIGVDNYNESFISNLNCCVKDMKDLNNALMKIGFEEKDIYILTSDADNFFERALKNNFDRKVNNIYKQVQEDDMVFIAFSGHGLRKGNLDYFCPQNVDLKNIEGTCISITQVMADMKNCKAKLKWIVVDACRGGSTNSAFNSHGLKTLGFQGASVFQEIASKDVPDGVWLFQSCGKKEFSYEEQQGGNSFFIKNFVASLSSFDQKGELKLLRVLGSTINKTSKEVENLLGKDQIPHFTAPRDSTDIILYKDEKYSKGKKLVKEGDEAEESKNYKLTYDKYKEAVALCPYVDSWREKLMRIPKSIVTVPDDYASIPEALAHVTDDGTIVIRPGKYELQGTIVVNRPVTIQGTSERAEDVVVNCKSAHAFQITQGSPSFLNLTASSEAVQCCGFHITGGTPKISRCIITSDKSAGIVVQGEKANPLVVSCIINRGMAGVVVMDQGCGEFKDCEFLGNFDKGIVVSSSANPTFTKCKIHENDIGIGISNNSLGKFNDCDIYENTTSGIIVQTSGNPTFTKCKIHDGKLYGLVVQDKGSGEFRDCEIYGNAESGIVVQTSGNPTFTKCKIHDGKLYGLVVQDKGSGEFRDCEIYGNTSVGVQVTDLGNPTVVNCRIYGGKSVGLAVGHDGLGKFINCEIYGNAKSGILVRTSGNPTVTGCKIHDGKDGGVSVFDKGKGTFNNNTLEKNYKNGQLLNWDIKPDAGKVSGSGNTPPIPEQ